MYGFPRRLAFTGQQLRRVSFPTNGTQTTFPLPGFASLRYPIRGYLQTSTALALIAPETMILLRSYGPDLITPSLTYTGNGSNPAYVGDGNDTTQWQSDRGGWVAVDLGVSKTIALVGMMSGERRGYTLYASTNETQWSLVSSVGTPVGGPYSTAFETAYTASTTPFRYWKFVVDPSWEMGWAVIKRAALYEETGSTSAVNFATAPATGTLILEYVAA